MMIGKRFAGLLAALFLTISGVAIAQPITALPSASLPLIGTEGTYIVQGGISKKITLGDLAANLVNNATVNIETYGGKCDSNTDDSPALNRAQEAIYRISPGGGTILMPATGHSCVLKSGVTLGSGISLKGVAGAYWPGYDDNDESHWTRHGSWIRCDDKVNSCISVAGNGSTVDGLNFWYTQPLPAGGNCGVTCNFTHDWTPTDYPFTISIKAPQNFNHFSNINIINATKCIDLEGPETGVGSFFTYFDHMQLGCFDTGMKLLRVDNAIAVNDVKFLVLWYQAYANVWGYMEGDTTVPGHKIDIDAAYLSDPAFNAVQFYQSYAAIKLSTASVGSGLGTVTFGGQGLQFTNTVFNQVCQAIILHDNEVIVNGDFTNTTINIDPQTSFNNQCGAGFPIAFNLNSNQVDLSFTNINGFEAQQLFNVGGGTSGGIHLSGRNRISYNVFGTGAPAIHVNTGGFVDMATGVNNLFPVGAAGPQCTGSCRNWPSVALGDTWTTGAAGLARQHLFLTTKTDGTFAARWGLIENSIAETGSNAGSDVEIQRYADSGAYLDSPFTIPRSTGVPFFINGMQMVAASTCSGKPDGTVYNNGGTSGFCGATGTPAFNASIQLTAPTSCAGKTAGTIWNDLGVAKFC